MRERNGWTWADNGTVAYAPTDDPRVLAIIVRDEYPEVPDHDSIVPTIIGYGYGSRAELSKLGEWGDASGVLDGWLGARSFMDNDTADRYARIFHDATVTRLSSRIDRYSWAVTFDTPAWRDKIGIDPAENIDHAAEVQMYLDGEVFFIGYAYNVGRVTTETPLPDPVDLERDGWTVGVTHSGYYGVEAAQESALDFDFGYPNVPELPVAH